MNKNNLKIEFRAVPYSTRSHVLEYRINPNQDITYICDYSFLGIKYKKRKKYNADWNKVYHFINYPSAYLYDEDYCYNPLLLFDKNELDFYKENFHSYGEFFDYLENENKKEKKEWLEKKQKHLENQNIWY